jgi:hypothetical protein
MVRARAGAGIFDKLEPEPHKNGPAPQQCIIQLMSTVSQVCGRIEIAIVPMGNSANFNAPWHSLE